AWSRNSKQCQLPKPRCAPRARRATGGKRPGGSPRMKRKLSRRTSKRDARRRIARRWTDGRSGGFVGVHRQAAPAFRLARLGGFFRSRRREEAGTLPTVAQKSARLVTSAATEKGGSCRRLFFQSRIFFATLPDTFVSRKSRPA